jgi:hypothetical protein
MDGKPYVTTNGATKSTVTAVSAPANSTLLAGKPYAFVSTTACWIKQGFGAQTAAPNTTNNLFVPANVIIFLHGSNGDNVSVVRDTADGNCSVWFVTEI